MCYFARFLRGLPADELKAEYLAACVGKQFPVLYEQMYGDRFCGHAPNYTTVAVDAEGLHNRTIPTRITGVEDGVLLGELTEA